jgi:hypothetical protein
MMHEEDKVSVKDFLLPWNVVFFQIGETMPKRKFFAKTAKIHQTEETVTLELKGKSPTGCVSNFKIRMNRREAKELFNNMIISL